jgi:hypothetical protein
VRNAIVLVGLWAGCGGAALKLTPIDASVQRPSNIAVYFTVDTKDGEPVAGLGTDAFDILEDQQPVSVLESKKTILNPEVAAMHYTLLLVDMSGSVTESGDVPTIVDAAQTFAERVQQVQKVAVYAFDGSADIQLIAGFGGGRELAAGVARLGSYRTRDPSTNLNGAIVEALKVLRRQMQSSTLPLTFGTLVVFTDGTDHAHRVTRDTLHQELASAPVDVLVIGVGGEIDDGELAAIGRNGAILSRDRAQVAKLFDAAAARVEAASRRYYLLGYCSPSRAGQHDVTIEAHSGGRSGALSYHFDAAGFGPQCDPTQKPSFNVKRPRAAPPEGGAKPREPAGGSHF